MFGRITHYAFDAVLFSAFLAGVKRSTGLTPSLSSDKITENKDFKKWIDNYLGVGEWVMDQSIAVLASTNYFERKR
ncbi:DUF1748-domain-containing protein [Aspergillus cavernicola]|uniref:DUF1748-domain-containing protein n=1 Tax=Aspergillus cavernicola TaxID=176166 RepID=A0ABR4I4W9_9EURO